MTAPGWCLVLALWGEGYGAEDVNRLARAARALSPDCRHVVLFTDRPRPGLDTEIAVRSFPAFFARPECFGWGYIAKLAVFSRAALPADMRCVYLDLDSVILGDVGRIAAELRDPDDMLMLPPADPLGFGVLRRALWQASGGRRFGTGNSSIMAWSSAAAPDIAARYMDEHARVGTGPAHMQIDDLFISWAGQPRLRAVPPGLGVSFRKAFLSRFGAVLWARRTLPWLRRRREGVAVVTFNGPQLKPAALAALPEGARIEDGRGRFGYWRAADMGPLQARLRAVAGG
jgi:hypothetical protein